MKTVSKLLQTTALVTGLFVTTQFANAAVIAWTGTNNITVNTNWAAAANWLGGVAPVAVDDARFINYGAEVAAGTINNVVDANITVNALRYNNTNGFHTTLIAPGVTLTVGTNGLTCGTETDNGNTQSENNAITGAGGTLVMNNTNGNFTVRQCTAGGNNSALRSTLDMSGLDTFNATINNMRVGQQISASLFRATGTLLLAKTNNISLIGVFTVGDTANNAAGQNIFNFGQTNSLLVNTMNIGYSKGLGQVRFNPALTSPALYLRGKSASRVTAINVGDASLLSATASATTGSMDFSLGSVDAQVGTMYLGRGQSGAGPGTGTLLLNAGIFDADITELGYQNTSGAGSVATGTITINGPATYVVNTSMRLARYFGSGGVPSGTLNVTTGSLLVKGNVIAGGGNSTITLNTATLTATNSGATVGLAGTPITTFNMSDSTLNLAAPASGSAIVANNLIMGGSGNIVNISSLPSIASYPVTFPLITYSGSIGGAFNLTLGTMPTGSPSYVAYITNNETTLAVELVVTAGPTPAKIVSWSATANGLWDTSTANWKTNLANAALAYSQGDFVTFDDTLKGTTNVTLTTTLQPGGITINNTSSNYLFTGTGKISGPVNLIKQGAGTLILANSGTNDFGGGVTISNGTIQIGTNGTTGNLPATGLIANDGSILYNRSDDVAVGNTITGLGSVTKNGNGTLTLSGNNGFAAGLTVNAGTVRLGSATAAGTGAVTVNSNATLVAGASYANAITLTSARLGGIANLANIAGEITAAGTSNTIYISDPQNLAANSEMNFINTLHGSGNITVLSGTNNINPDGGVGFRLRGTGSSDFTGNITIGHNVKGELQTSSGGTFSPANTAKMILICGDAARGGTNSAATTSGGYSELNVRNNSGGDTSFGNDVELSGTGLAILNPLGTAPSGSTVGLNNLKIGGGQELGIFLNSGNSHPITFQTVNLTGGTATFSPKIPGFNAPTAVGADLSLGDVSQNTAGAGVTMAGLRMLSITGTANYTGPTTVNSGTLRVNGALGKTAVTVNNTGTLTGNGTLDGAVTVNNGGTLSPGSGGIGTLTINSNLTLGGNVLVEIDKGLSPSNDIVSVSGALIYGGTITVTNIGGTPLIAGDSFQVFPAGGTGSPTIVGQLDSGLAWSFNHVTGVLSVIGQAPSIGFGVTNGVMTLSWPIGSKLIWQTNSLSTGLNANWTDYPDTSNPVNITIDPTIPTAFFGLQPQ